MYSFLKAPTLSDITLNKCVYFCLVDMFFIIGNSAKNLEMN